MHQLTACESQIPINRSSVKGPHIDQ